VLNAGDTYEPAGMLHNATTALDDMVYLFIGQGPILYFDDNRFTGYLNWEVFERLREKAGAPVQQAAE
jgi:hypothetical protein